MADLINLLEHKKNTNVLVNGTVYKIGADGVVKGVPDADATKLLQNERVWKTYDPKRASAMRAQAKAANKGKMQLLDVNGNPITDKLPPDTPGPTMDPLEEVYNRPDPTADVQKSDAGPPPVPESVETEEEEAEEDDEEDVGDDEEDEDEEVEEDEAEEEEAEEGGDWPDPDESMAIGYLREMAEAYEVEFTPKTSKKTLVKRISEAMYE